MQHDRCDRRRGTAAPIATGTWRHCSPFRGTVRGADDRTLRAIGPSISLGASSTISTRSTVLGRESNVAARKDLGLFVLHTEPGARQTARFFFSGWTASVEAAAEAQQLDRVVLARA